MADRIALQNLLESILGSENVYFQPPESLKMNYPCIVYSKTPGNVLYADDNPYRLISRYKITVIDKNPDSIIPDKIGLLKMCSFDQHFVSGNLNHDVFNIYF